MKKMESVISSIRDILRKDGVTGMDSINHCIVFMFSRLLTKELCRKLNIDEIYSFENILKDEDGEELGDQDFKARIVNKTKNNLIHSIVNELGFKNIKFKLESPQNLKLIYKKLSELDAENLAVKYDIIGTIYELHLKSGTSNSLRDLGQYYTHRLVIDYMIKLCDPKINDGVVEKIVDPTMGTGGFLTMSIKFLNKKYNNKVNWKKNKDSIIGFDIDDNVRNMALLNILLECGELCKETIVKQDTLHNDMKFKDGKLKDTVLEKADVILANEPMGLKALKYTDFCDRIKNIKISGTKAEPAFLQLFMASLNKNGRCSVIVPDGVLFNDANQHQGTRKYLVENFELQKVISLNGDFFLNTGVKTSILFFVNTGKKTKEINFCEIKLRDDLVEETSIAKVSYKDIVEKNYSLYANKYRQEEKNNLGDINLMNLNDVCDFLPTTKHTSSIGNAEGKYRFYNSSQTDKLFLDTFEVDNESIIIGNGGSICIHYDKKFTPSKHVTVCKKKDDMDINLKYVYYYLVLNVDSLKQLSAGSTIQWLNKTNLGNFKIPIPTARAQELIVEKLDLISSSIEKSQKMMDEYKEIIKYHVECNTTGVKNIAIEAVCDMVIGKKTSKEISKDGEYDFYNGSADSPVGKSVDFSYELNEDYILLIKDGGAGEGKYGDKIGLGKVFFVKGKTAFTTSVVALTNKDEKNINMKYLYYYLRTIKNNLMDLAQYTTGLGHLTTGKLKVFQIPVPSKEKQEEIVKYCDNVFDLIEQMEKQIEASKKLVKMVMDNYLKASLNDKKKKNDESEPDNISSESEDEKPKKKHRLNKSSSSKKNIRNDSDFSEESENELPKKNKKVTSKKKQDSDTEDEKPIKKKK